MLPGMTSKDKLNSDDVTGRTYIACLVSILQLIVWCDCRCVEATVQCFPCRPPALHKGTYRSAMLLLRAGIFSVLRSRPAPSRDTIIELQMQYISLHRLRLWAEGLDLGKYESGYINICNVLFHFCSMFAQLVNCILVLLKWALCRMRSTQQYKYSTEPCAVASSSWLQ